MATLEIHPDNSVAVQITLSNPITDLFVNDATVVAEIQDSTDNSVIQSSFSLPFVASSNGVYRATLSPIAGLTLGVIYNVIIDATGTDSLIGHWVAPIKASLAGIS